MMCMAAVFGWYGLQFASFGAIQKSEMSGINMLAIYCSFPVAGITWILFLIEKLIDDYKLIISEQTEAQR